MNRFWHWSSSILIALAVVAAASLPPWWSGSGVLASGSPKDGVTLLPTPRELNWRGSAGSLPAYIEVITDRETGRLLGSALDDLLPRMWDPPEHPLFAPAFTQAGEGIPPAGKGLIVHRLLPESAAPGDSASSTTRTSVSLRIYELLAKLLQEPPVDPERGLPARLVLLNLSRVSGGDAGTLPADFAAYRELGLAAIPVNRLRDLPQEAYFLTAGYDEQLGAVAVAASYSERGLLYAALTWATLARQVQAAPLATITDWPAYRIRGVIEGFYGTPWSAADRLNQIAFYPWVKMNTYVYAPKDDPYHREKWRELYPEAELQRLAELVELANRYQIDFVFAISPGLSVVFSSDADFARLVAKTEQLRAIGVRRFALLLDDIPKTLNNAADRVRFRNDVGAGQAFLINRYAAYLREKEPGYPLIVVPTEYYDLATSPYKSSFAANVAPDVIIYWTGEGVVARTLTLDQGRRAISLWRHSILMWDNYPVNDYVREQLLLGPLENRDDLTSLVDQPVPGAASADHRFLGFTFNPMNEAESSKLPLATGADYAWNPAAYSPQASWQAALAQLIPPAARDGFLLLARFYPTSALHPADELTSEIQQLLLKRMVDAVGKEEADDFFARLEALDTLPTRLANDRLADELRPYIELLSLTGNLARSYYQLLDAERERGGLPAEPSALAAEWLARADWLTRFEYWQELGKRMGGGMADYIRSFAARVAEPLGFFAGSGVRPQTSLSAYESFTVEKLADGRNDTFFWSGRAPRPGDFFGLDLGRVVPIESITLGMASTSGSYARPQDYLEHYELRISADGREWKVVGRFDKKPNVEVALPPGTRARFVRVVATASQTSWVQVRELSVSPWPAAYDIELSGGRVEEPGRRETGAVPSLSAAQMALPVSYTSELAGVLDGDPATAVILRATTAPVTLTITRPDDSNVEEKQVFGGVALILGDVTASPGSLFLQVQDVGGSWSTLEDSSAVAVSGGTQVLLFRFPQPRPLSAYRMVWQPGPAEVERQRLVVREFYPLPPAVAVEDGE
ncbi:MAG: beta-N-acetylglucosaminidase domain-containing protein [Limnochordales bacterium]|nr:beta-N-acetylglucosaminidase domain-containing protein [Limnochordales bacterium]